ncbi:MAG: hypothetical protein MAG795_00647 [Candidatus Woesearchaeota archaeon]|nr:hypothetical protein [Candidatus Woesearchaeota archaeon]
MKLKLALGIGLPTVLIVILVVLSTSNIGFTMNSETIESIPASSVYAWDNKKINIVSDKKGINNRNNITSIQTINLENNFWLPRRYELPIFRLCLNDKDGVKKRETLQPKYQVGIFTQESINPIYGDIQYDFRSSGQSIEARKSTKKQIRIILQPKSFYNSDQELDPDTRNYDEIILIEAKDQSRYVYNFCKNLKAEEIGSAIHIPIAG